MQPRARHYRRLHPTRRQLALYHGLGLELQMLFCVQSTAPSGDADIPREKPIMPQHAPQQALILFAHGARDPEWAGPARRVAEALRRERPDARVELAFLEFMTPTLAEVAAAALADGVVQVRIVPLFLAQGGHLKKDLPLLVEELRQRYPACQFELAPAVGEDQDVIDAMARCAGR